MYKSMHESVCWVGGEGFCHGRGINSNFHYGKRERERSVQAGIFPSYRPNSSCLGARNFSKTCPAFQANNKSQKKTLYRNFTRI